MKLRRIGTRVELLGVDLSDLSVISEDCWFDWLACISMFGMIGVLTLTLLLLLLLRVFIAVNLLSLSKRIWSRLMLRPRFGFLD